jgi:hypothetical protein
MSPNYKKSCLILFSALLVSFHSSQDDSRRYIRVGQVQLPNNAACVGQTWATIINSNLAKSIRVHYIMTVNGVSATMSCDALPSSITPRPNDYGTLLGCAMDISYRIISSEYIP